MKKHINIAMLREKVEFALLFWHRRKVKAARRPKVLRRWYQWESVRSEHTHVYYVTSKADAQEVALIAQRCDETLQCVTTLVGVGPPKRPVIVFLYPDLHSFQRCEQIQGTPFPALARDGNISLAYNSWQRIAKMIAHELTHVVTAQCVCSKSFYLLDEGLAMYVSNKLHSDISLLPTPRLDLPLRTLAANSCLGQYLANHNTSREAYDHVYSFAWYLIERYGMDRFMKLFRGSTGNTRKLQEKRFVTALHKTYNMTLEDVEQQWRQNSLDQHS